MMDGDFVIVTPPRGIVQFVGFVIGIEVFRPTYVRSFIRGEWTDWGVTNVYSLSMVGWDVERMDSLVLPS